MTTSGRRHTMPWRVTWYVRDPKTGKPTGGGRRAFARMSSALACEEARRAEGYTTECWREDTLPGAG